IDQARTEKPDAALWAQAQGNAGSSDPQAIMDAYIRLRLNQEFPTSFSAAAASGKDVFQSQLSAGGTLTGLVDYWGDPLQFSTGIDAADQQMKFLIWSTHLTQNPPSWASNNNTSYESSVCLYLALSVQHRGMNFDASTLSPKEVKAFQVQAYQVAQGGGAP